MRKVMEERRPPEVTTNTCKTTGIHIDYGTTVLSVWPLTGRA